MASFELKEGENIITLLIKKKLTNLREMFYDCKNLEDIEELKYLNVKSQRFFIYVQRMLIIKGY